MTIYYNEIDEFAAEILRNLIAAGLIAPGVVDTRSIEDVHPSDLKGFTQCHFFAGIGGWSLALRSAGWADDRSVWTGSCPCQPFSAAGQGAGFADERHLWPAFHHLIRERKPAIVLGEQVASKDADPWIDLVHTDLEALGYAFGAVPFPSAGVGAPHIRDRLYWVAHADGSTGDKGRANVRGRADGSDAQPRPGSGGSSLSGRLGDTDHPRLEGHAGNGGAAGRQGQERSVAAAGVSVRLADDARGGRREECEDAGGIAVGNIEEGLAAGLVHGGADSRTGPTNGFWRDADWLGCRDGKWRPVEPGTFPLAHGLPAGLGSLSSGLRGLVEVAGLDGESLRSAKSFRVGALRGYGNAINAEVAQVFVEIVMESIHPSNQLSLVNGESVAV
jgi:DNA (cytosine-5)-methyltransferase 1